MQGVPPPHQSPSPRHIAYYIILDAFFQTNLVQLANFKIMAAKSLEDGRSAAALLEKAVDLCSDREELIETLSVLVATEGRMNGALLLGRTSLG